MPQFDIAEARRLALSSIGALLLSATCVAAAVAPARAAEPGRAAAPLTVADWQAKVGGQLDAKLSLPADALARRDNLTAAVDLSFDRDGNFVGATVSQSSGVRAVDSRMRWIAERIVYPPLPAGYRGRPQTVTMLAYFGQAATADDAPCREEAAKALAAGVNARHDRLQAAALPSG